MARITSELFVAALVRRAFGAGGFAAVLRKGADMAGAVFVVHRPHGVGPALYGPAPQAVAGEGGARHFMPEAAEGEAGIAARLEREARFDPDFWLVEIETAASLSLASLLDIADEPA